MHLTKIFGYWIVYLRVTSLYEDTISKLHEKLHETRGNSPCDNAIMLHNTIKTQYLHDNTYYKIYQESTFNMNML